MKVGIHLNQELAVLMSQNATSSAAIRGYGGRRQAEYDH